MSYLSALSQKVAILTDTVNNFIKKIKKTDEFNQQTELDAASKIRVYINGESQYVTIQQIVDSAVLSKSDVGINGIVSGKIEYLGGLKYKSLNLVYRFNNVLYYSNGYLLTLNIGDANNPRIDVIYGDIDQDGQLFILEGTATVAPLKPVLEWAHQLELTFVNIPVNGTAPIGITEILAYNENAQEAGGEFDTSTNTPTTIDLANTDDFDSGTMSIKFINVGIVGVNFNSSVKRNGSDISFIKFRIKLIISLNNTLRLSLFVNGTLRVGDVYITHGNFNFDAYLLNVWQTVLIPGTAFRVDGVWENVQYDQLYLSNRKSGATFFVDSIIIQTGLNSQNTAQGHTHSNLPVLEEINQSMIDKLTALSNTTIAKHYADATAMMADQATQKIGNIYTADAAGGDPTVLIGSADYEYLGVANGLIADYRKLSEQESMDLAAPTLSIQDENGVEKFLLTFPDILQFEGFSYDVPNKRIVNSLLIIDTYYVDTVNGSDLTGSIGIYNKPFKTLDAVFALLQDSNQVFPTTPYIYIELISNGTYAINGKFNPTQVYLTNLEIRSELNVVLDWSANTNTVLAGNSSNGVGLRFIIPNGEMKFSQTVAQTFSRIYDLVLIVKKINSTTALNLFVINTNKFIKKVEIEELTLINNLFSYNNSSSIAANINIGAVIATIAKKAIVNGTGKVHIKIKGDITGVGSLILGGHRGTISVNDINTFAITQFTNSINECVITFNNTIITNTWEFSEWSCTNLTLKGEINDTSHAMTNSVLASANGIITFDNFKADFKTGKLTLYNNYTFNFINSFIKCSGELYDTKTYNGTILNLYRAVGLFALTPTYLCNSAGTSIINDYAGLKTNIPTLGANVTYNQKFI